MSRILLGVSGGIAAYKACELTRLLVKAGHEVVPLVTPGAERFVRAETFLALARRPPGDDPYLHLTRGDLLVVAPCTANTLAKLAHGLADNLLDRGGARAPGAGARRAGDEPADVGAPGDPRQRRDARSRAASSSSARTRARRPRANGAWGGWRSPPRSRAASSSCSRRAHARRAARRSSPPAAPASRSTPRASSATARPAAWASRSPRRPAGAGRTSSCSPRTSPCRPPPAWRRSPRPTAESMLDAALALADFDIALLAAAVADYRPAVALAGKRPKSDEPWTVELEPTADIARRLGEAKRPGQLLVTFGAELGEEGLERKRRMLDDEERRSRRLQRRVAADIALRERRQRGRARGARRRPAGGEGAEGRDRGCDPRRGGATARR